MPAVRIASLLASGTEIVCALGLGDRLVAVSHECDWPPEVAKKPRVTRALVDAAADGAEVDRLVRDRLARGQPLYEIDLARLAALAPDLIVTQAQCDVCAVRYEDVVAAARRVAALRETRIVALSPRTLTDVFNDILRVGEAAGRIDSARRCVAALRRRIDRVRQQTLLLSRDARPRTVLVEWIEPLMIAANWMPELIEIAGGRSGLTEAGRHSGSVEWDQLLSFDPEVIVAAPCGWDLRRTAAEMHRLERRPGWRGLAAVRAGRVFIADGNAYFNRSGPRLVESLEMLAAMEHPTPFASSGEPLARAWRRWSPAPDAQGGPAVSESPGLAGVARAERYNDAGPAR